MQSEPFATFEEAKEAAKQYNGYDEVYARPNPNKEQGGYIVIYGNFSWERRPLYGGCPRGR